MRKVMTVEGLDPALYQVLPPEEQEQLCRLITAEVKSFVPVTSPTNRGHWDQVWSEAAKRVQVCPPFIGPSGVLRVGQALVKPASDWLELLWYKGFRERLLKRWFEPVSAIYEFGCGSGWNLLAASELWHRQKRYVGLDWSHEAVKRLPLFGMEGRTFDFFQPDYSLELDPSSGVLTVGALEQTGDQWQPFLDYLLERQPAICVHVEPILEWYDPTNLVDQTAIQYHLARDLWRGFPASLDKLEAAGRVQVLERRRSYFGSRYIEGYNCLVWKPLSGSGP